MFTAMRQRAGLASLTLLDIAVAVAATSLWAPAANAQNVPNWAGFYIGANGGYRHAGADFASAPYFVTVAGNTASIPAFRDRFDLQSGVYGVHFGYNFLILPGVLIGFETDWSWGIGKDNIGRAINGIDFSGDGFSYRRNAEVTLEWQATLRARLGYVVNAWLAYLTGGVGFTRVGWRETAAINVTFPTGFATTSAGASETLTGFVGGGGLEYMFAPNWIARVEYLYFDMSGFNVPTGFGPQTGTLGLNPIHTLRFGISIKN